ncbi:MAG TPA: hypothetical protein VJ874_06725 [Candidatus Thermoplasmatota archaeon]|nr:hypothetical protein [Candidatus Thermoplasmatota archaeon]
MRKGMVLLALAVLMTVGLAGCSSGGDAAGFSIDAPGEPGGEYRFKASGSADNYTWDMGDHLTVLYGKEVGHAYDFANGVVNVVLTMKTGDQSEDFRKPITLGTGANAEPTFVLEGQRNWTVLGETLKFSARLSTDPDGDPLRYSWSCVRTGDAIRQPTHVHPGFQGVSFATAPAGSVTAVNAASEMPPADRTLSGDLCEALGSGGRPSKDATIEGTFTKTGVYDVYLLASDPVHPTTSGKYHFVVTPPEERPAPVFETAFFGNLTGGSDGLVQGVIDQAEQEGDFDRMTHTFTLPLTGYGGNMTTEYTGDSPAEAAALTWELKRGTVVIAQGGADGETVPLPAADMKPATYTLTVDLQGISQSYAIHVAVPLDRDPFKVY